MTRAADRPHDGNADLPGRPQFRRRYGHVAGTEGFGSSRFGVKAQVKRLQRQSGDHVRNVEAVGSSPITSATVVSRDIPDGCRETSRTILGSSMGLVVLRRVDGEVAEEFPVLGDHPDVEVLHQ